MESITFLKTYQQAYSCLTYPLEIIASLKRNLTCAKEGDLQGAKVYKCS